jgi:hypothetical protein
MSNYDLLAISQKPDLYFSSNDTDDQSGKNLYGVTNGADNVGQPIIAGNPSSWRIQDGGSVDIDANPIFFRTNTQMEFVIQKIQPVDTVCIFGDSSDLNGIFLNPTGVQVRFVDADLNQRSTSLLFTEWPERMHIVLSFDTVYCTLRVNDISAQVSYRETDPDSITDVSFKTTVGNTYYLDGLGIYSDSFDSKYEYIKAPSFNYTDFIGKTYSATGTLFDGYRIHDKLQVPKTEFKPDPIDVDYYIYTKAFMIGTDDPFSSISIESNYSGMQMQYQTNDITWSSFTGNTSFVPSADFFILQIRVNAQDISKTFVVNIFTMYDDRITTNTPAELTPNGGPLYPEAHDISIVNFPDGVELYGISYEGEWIEYIPNSIEIIFMPKTDTKTVVFENSDGSASCGTGGSITGFTAYLNGQSVADLDDVRVNQWNHLVLTDASPAADTFYLNSTTARADENIIEYAFMAAYPSVLDAGTIEQLYAIISSFHKLSVVENPSDIAEGELDGSSPFKIYTYAWAIVGGGGV